MNGQASTNGNGGMNLKWAQLFLWIAVQLVAMGAMFGVLKFEVEDHARRLAEIEKKQDANFIPRSEYDNRHADLEKQIQELREEIRDMGRRK